MIEAIKTILNGLVSFIRTNRPNWAQNDPDALDYVKNRPFYETEGNVLTQITTYDLAKKAHSMASRNEPIYINGVKYTDFTLTSTAYAQYVKTADGAYSLSISESASVFSFAPSDAVWEIYQYGTLIKKIDPKFLPTPTADTAGAIKADAAETIDTQPVRLGADGKLYSSGIPIFTTSGTGSKYTANVPEITKLVKGMLVVMIPHTDSNTNLPSLIINGGNQVTIFRPCSYGGVTGWSGRSNLISGTPYLLIYTGNRWLSINSVKPDGLDLQNFVSPDSGGTGRVSLTKGSYLVGNNQGSVLLKTPSEVLADIGAIPTPASAEVGQTIVVKAVDENGKPTEWEAVDPMVVGSSTTGSTKKFKIAVDDSGTITATEVTA